MKDTRPSIEKGKYTDSEKEHVEEVISTLLRSGTLYTKNSIHFLLRLMIFGVKSQHRLLFLKRLFFLKGKI